MSTVCYLFLSVCLTIVAAENKASKPTLWTAVEHGTLLVPCNTSHHDDIELYWTKNQTRSTFYQAGRNLVFTDILREDSGDYVCHAFNTTLPGDNETNSNVTVEVIHVDVQYPAEIDSFYLGPATITENETFSVSVNFQGNPGPTWEIRNNHTGRVIFSATNGAAGVSLPKNHVFCGDTAFWECTGYNRLNHGVNVTRGTTLEVLCPPRPKTNDPNKRIINARVGDSAFFSVDVVGYPYPSYHWSRDDGEPMPDWLQTDYPESTTLNITNIAVEDFTSYTLTMRNDIGTHSMPLELKAHGSPMRAYDLDFSDVTYNGVTLSWRSGFDMGSKQHFMVMKLIGNQFTQISDTIYESYTGNGVGHLWRYTLSNLDSSTDYNLTVMAENEDGFLSALAERSVYFRTKAQPNPDPNMEDNVAERNTWILIGSLAGTLVVLAVLAFLVYMVKYRNMRTSYVHLKGDVKPRGPSNTHENGVYSP